MNLSTEWHSAGDIAQDLLRQTVRNAARTGNIQTLDALRRALEKATDGPFERELSELLDQILVEEEELK